jgi:hypothetical protein
VAGALILADFLWLSRGLGHAGPGYRTWALDHGLYSDIIQLSVDHYVRAGLYIHPLPYLHDRIEYPVLLGFTLWLPTWLPGGPPTWFAVAGVLTAAATFGSIALVQRRDLRAAWWLAATPALLLDAGINWDLIGIAFLVGGVVWFGERRYGLSGAATAAGSCFKLFPVVIAPMALSALGARWFHAPAAGRRAAGRALASWVVPAALVGAVVVVPLGVVATSNVVWFIRFNGLRPQKDSVWELVTRSLGSAVVTNRVVNVASLVVVVVVMGYGAWRVWRVADADQSRAVALASAVVIIVWMAVNKVWNPQYVLWVFAAGALISMPARFGVALGAVSVYDSVFEFAIRRPDVDSSLLWSGEPLVAVRTLLFLAMAGWAARELHRLEARPVGPPPATALVRSAA